jgi:hypothetical protein
MGDGSHSSQSVPSDLRSTAARLAKWSARQPPRPEPGTGRVGGFPGQHALPVVRRLVPQEV